MTTSQVIYIYIYNKLVLTGVVAFPAYFLYILRIQGHSHEIALQCYTFFQDQSSASKGLYRPLSPRVGPPTQQGSAASSVGGSLAAAQGGPGSPVAPLRPRQVIVSSPGSPSSSSDSQSGSESVKHCLPSRVSSPMSTIRGSPSSQALRSSPASATASAVASPGVRRSPVRHSPVRVSMASSPASSGPRSSPSVTSLTRPRR
ncbi:unnamed protein product [Acanthoscelides obtectus]|uniref:Uncharacterized protein n=1 Tax=Acanthoscelides obtectus TaxID=200917 RepID=A0A9P0M9A8_ACAOB|nr:unnamed protein product [Acanthoscelides obtectus]CAK1620492.1 hypothetical protein AOBTE_LOCUS403 [Acanthoscelides obtectus]